MENISKYIEKLLAQHDYVIVPGLGGFLVRIEPAKVLPNKIVPPTATVSFNPLMQHADGLLAIEISKTEQISYREAVEYIEMEVQKFIHKLQHSKSKIHFGELGHFSLNESNLFTFHPTNFASFLPGNFQHNTLNVQPRYYRVERQQQQLTQGKRHSLKFYHYGAAAMLVLGLFLSSPKVTDSSNKEYASFVPTNTVSISTPSQVVRKTTIIEKHIKLASAKKDSAMAEAQSARYHIIVATVNTRKSAEQLCEELKTENFNTACVVASGKVFRTSIKSFDNKSEALDYMEQIRKSNPRFENAWVKCN